MTKEDLLPFLSLGVFVCLMLLLLFTVLGLYFSAR